MNKGEKKGELRRPHGKTLKEKGRNAEENGMTKLEAGERQVEADTEKLSEQQEEGVLVQFLFPIRYALSRCSLARDPRSLYCLRPPSGITVTLSGCGHASFPMDGRLACLLDRYNAISVRTFLPLVTGLPTNADLSTRRGQSWLDFSTMLHRLSGFAEILRRWSVHLTTVHGTLISRNGCLQRRKLP